MLLLTFSISLIILVIGYPLYLSLLLLLQTSDNNLLRPNDQTQTPFVSLLIPTYNEGKFILEKIQNTLELTYSHNYLEIIFIDGSNDGTKEIIDDCTTHNSNFKLINQKERKGKPAALNLALQEVKGDIVVISDADALLQPDCIERLTDRLNAPEYGLAGALTEVVGKSQVTNFESRYWELSNFMRVLEARVDSSSSVIAACYAFKKKLIPRFEEFILADDMWSSIKVRELGYRADYLLEAKALDYGVSDSLRKDVTHKIRKGYACLQVLGHFKGMLFNSAYGRFGMLILPSHWLRYIVCPYALFTFIFSGLFLLVSPHAISILIIGAVLAIWGITLVNKMNLLPRDRNPTSIKAILISIFMFIILQGTLILAHGAKLCRLYDVKWQKTR